MHLSLVRDRDYSFYEKAVAMLFAAGVGTSTGAAAIVHQTGLNDTSFTLTLAGGAPLASTAGMDLQFSSSAIGYVKGIGNLRLPSGALQTIFRGNEGTVIGEGVDPFTGTSILALDSSQLQNNAELGADNYVAFSFTSPDVNGGEAVYGWARFTIVGFDNVFFTEWAYQDDGSDITLGAIPEPSGLALLALGAAGATAFHRKRRQKAA